MGVLGGNTKIIAQILGYVSNSVILMTKKNNCHADYSLSTTVGLLQSRKNKLMPGLWLLILLSIAPFSTAQAVVLKIASLAPDGSLWVTKMRSAAKQITEQTEGRVKFKFYPGGVMGNSQSVMRKMRFGQLQGSVFTAGDVSEIYPDIQLYALPFLFETQQQVDFVRQRMDPLLLQGLNKQGLISFGLTGAGFAYTMSNAPIHTLEGFRKHKVWAPSGDRFSRVILKYAGISPVTLPLADVLTGLQTGMIDVVTVSPIGAIAFQWYTKLSYMNVTPVSYIYGLLALDKKAFNKIKAEDQKVVQTELTRISRELNELSWVDAENAQQALLKQGVSLTETNPDVLNEWLGFAKSTVDELVGQGVFTRATFDLLNHYLDCFKLADQSCE